MGITANRAYNDPNLGAAFGSLAQAFMPPSGSDLSGYATAAATRDQASRLAWLFANSQDPTASERSALTGIQNYGATPEGARMTDATNRYGYDTTAATSRANNADTVANAYRMAQLADAGDTTRNAYTTDQNNATDRYGIDTTAGTARRGQDVTAKSALDVAGLDNTARQALQDSKPVILGQNETAYLPDQTTKATGLSGMFSGAMNVGQGETTFTPSGQKLEGQAKPLSETEVLGAILNGLPATDQRTKVMGDVPVETIVRDGKPVVVSRPDAVGQQPASSGAPVQVLGPGGSPILMDPAAAAAMGATPYDPKAGAMDVKNYVTPDGRTGSAAIAQDGTLRDAMTGDALPEGTRTFTGSLTGSAQDTGLGGKSTEASDKAGIFYSRAAPASANIDAAVTQGFVPSDADYEATLGALSGLPNAATRHLISDEGRAFYVNAQNFMMAILRPDTGAAFGKDEFQSYARVFIPMPGDDPRTLAAKSAARSTALSALQGTSRGSAEAIAAIMQQNGLPIPPEMAAVMARKAQENGGSVASPANAGPSDPAGGPAAGNYAAPPQAAIDYLKANPSMKDAFELKYGPGSAAAAGVN